MKSIFRETIEKMYDGTCTVIVRQKNTNPDNKRTSFEEVVSIENQPCHLSYKSSPTTGNGNVAAKTQEIKLFLTPEKVIPPGSKIEVTQNGVKETYEASGMPQQYPYHQEILLKLFERWS